MLYLFKLFRGQVNKFRDRGLCDSPWRYFFRWRRSLDEKASSVADEQPWITFETIDFLESVLKPEHRVFEYGGGGSTLFFVKRVAEVITVEHNREWYDILEKLMREKHASNWKGNFIPPEKGTLATPPDPSNPAHYASRDDDPGHHFRSYASAIDAYADEHFDLVLVDGRARPSCIAHAVPKLKTGGYLVVDNSDREYYFTQLQQVLAERFRKAAGSFGPSPYAKDFTKTTIWKKIK